MHHMVPKVIKDIPQQNEKLSALSFGVTTVMTPHDTQTILPPVNSKSQPVLALVFSTNKFYGAKSLVQQQSGDSKMQRNNWIV